MIILNNIYIYIINLLHFATFSSQMRTIWIREVRYYKYAVFICMFLILCGIILLNEYSKQNNNIGIIINTDLIHNITYSIPIYKVMKEGNIYIMYDPCIIVNVTECTQTHFTANMIVHFRKINGYYIVSNRDHFLLYFAIFALSFASLILTVISYAYYDFYKLRKKEFRMWSNQKKYDMDIIVENDPSSYLFY